MSTDGRVQRPGCEPGPVRQGTGGDTPCAGTSGAPCRGIPIYTSSYGARHQLPVLRPGCDPGPDCCPLPPRSCISTTAHLPLGATPVSSFPLSNKGLPTGPYIYAVRHPTYIDGCWTDRVLPQGRCPAATGQPAPRTNLP